MESTTTSITPVQRFWRLLKPDRREISSVYAYAVFNGLINLSLPLGIQAIINLIQGGQVSTSWIVLVAIVVLGVTLAGVLQIFQLKIVENLQQRIFARASFEFAWRIPRIRLEALYRHHAPELMNRFFDTISVQKGLSKLLIDFSAAALQVIFGMVLLSLYHPFFILFSLVLVVLVYAIFRFTAKRGLQTSLNESKYKYEVAHWLEEVARTNSTFKLAGVTDLPMQRTNDHVENYLKARNNHFSVLISQYWMLVIFKALVTTGLLAIGGILVMEQRMNIGQFVAAEIIILLVMAAVEKLILSLETIYDVLTSLEKIGAVTDMELEENKGVELADQCSEAGIALELDEVSFSYPKSHYPVLQGLSFGVKCGERIVLRGANGAGKSTLLHVIAGLYTPQGGRISYNSLPQGNLRPEGLRSVIGDCLSQEQLFQGTVLENITMGRPHATFENVKWAVDNLGLSKFINELSKGYETHILPGGKQLPGSIVQRLLLARAIVDKPRLLLLEDAFEHLEEPDRSRIIDFLMDPVHGWTIVAASANDYLARKADKVVVLHKGKVQRSGSWESVSMSNSPNQDGNA